MVSVCALGLPWSMPNPTILPGQPQHTAPQDLIRPAALQPSFQGGQRRVHISTSVPAIPPGQPCRESQPMNAPFQLSCRRRIWFTASRDLVIHFHSSSSCPAKVTLVQHIPEPSRLHLIQVQLVSQSHQEHAVYKGIAPMQGDSRLGEVGVLHNSQIQTQGVKKKKRPRNML